MNRDIIINATNGGVEIALLEDSALVELHHETDDTPFQVGDIFVARVKRTALNMNAAFFEIKPKNASINISEIQLCSTLKNTLDSTYKYQKNGIQYEPQLFNTYEPQDRLMQFY